MTRLYPIIEDQTTKPTEPISIICVRFSGDFEHNIMNSDCVHDALNDFIVVNNHMNMMFDTLGQAINHGIERSKNDLVVVVHEDVVLVSGWQARFEKSLFELEKHDPNWAIAGAVGWKENMDEVGHWSDPHSYKNTFEAQPFGQVFRLDEQLLIFRKSRGIVYDANLPSIHNIGEDLARQAMEKGFKTYAIDAPTIHKYADEKGDLIQTANDSPKIQDRYTLTYLADKDCSDEYLSRKWNLDNPLDNAAWKNDDRFDLESPIILLGRGGGGTRLLSTMATDVGLFIGNNVNISGDCMDMVSAIYRSLVRKHRCPDLDQQQLTVMDLRRAANKMISSAPLGQKWGFKLPEILLILPEICQAFPKATFVNFKRNPMGTVLRRSHMTARPDNHIGRIALKEAYEYFSYPIPQLSDDDPLFRMVITTMHQLAITEDFRTTIPPNHWLELTFEETISNPKIQLDSFANFCQLPIQSEKIVSMIDTSRSRLQTNKFSPKEIIRAERLINHFSLEQEQEIAQLTAVHADV